MSETVPKIRLPLIWMLLAGPAGAAAVGLLVWLLSVPIPRIDPASAWWGALAAAGGLVIGLLATAPWLPGTPQSLTMRMFGGQGLSMFAALACGAVVWFMVQPEPIAAGLTAAAGYFAGLMLQIAVFGAAARAAIRPDGAAADGSLDNRR